MRAVKFHLERRALPASPRSRPDRIIIKRITLVRMGTQRIRFFGGKKIIICNQLTEQPTRWNDWMTIREIAVLFKEGNCFSNEQVNNNYISDSLPHCLDAAALWWCVAQLGSNGEVNLPGNGRQWCHFFYNYDCWRSLKFSRL